MSVYKYYVEYAEYRGADLRFMFIALVTIK